MTRASLRNVSGETVMHQQWSGKGLATRQQKPTVKYVYAKEGAIGWMDNVAVPKGAPDVENAKKFLNFLMDPENIALQQKSTGYQSAVMGSGKYLSPDVGDSPEFNPPKDLKIDVLLLGVQNDPIVGSEAVAATAATVINAGAASKRVMWQGIGHGASIYSPCAVPPLVGYLDSGKLPGTDTYCPA